MGKIYDDGGVTLTETTGALGSPALELALRAEPGRARKLDTEDVHELHNALGKWLEDVAPL